MAQLIDTINRINVQNETLCKEINRRARTDSGRSATNGNLFGNDENEMRDERKNLMFQK